LSLTGISCVPLVAMRPRSPVADVRVALLKHAPEVMVETRGGYTILDPAGNKVLSEGRRLPETRFSLDGHYITVGPKRFDVEHLRLSASREIVLSLNGMKRRFRGDIDFIRNPEGTLLVVNRLDVEDYIRGVLYHEISHRWPMAAMKAQAVAARSYALYQKKANAHKRYDLTSDIYSQVYGGKTSEKYRTNLAVERTRGEVLMFRGRLVPAYFHSTCGGHTENVTELWTHPDLPPLKGVPCRFCFHSPHYYWERKISLADIREKLNTPSRPVKKINDIYITGRNASGRIRTLKIVQKNDAVITVSGKDFRQAIGPNLIKSNNYRVHLAGDSAVFNGKGWGHGVGLCQWGAQKMAQQGYDYRAILEYYYPHAVVMPYPGS